MTLRRRLVGCALALLIAAAAGGWPASAQAASYPNDPFYARQWHLRRINAPEAWKVTKGKGITIAIIDTGVDRLHLDLRGNMSPLQYDAVTGGGNAGDICPVQNKQHICHGTAVAGTAAAVTNNKRGVAGVAPEAKIMAIRAASADTSVNANAVASGVMWAADHGANVINLSLGAQLGPVPVPEVWDAAILYAVAKGVLVVASAGNSGAPSCADPGLNPAVLCVGASDQVDGITSFSNYGVRIDVVAPGIGIWTTTVSTPQDTAGYYGPEAGTSFSAPIVSGIGALVMSMGANNVLAATIIRASAKQLGLPGYNITYGFGRVDALAAVNLCKQICH